MLPSSLKLATTAPRFHLSFPMNEEDPGLRLLVLDELGAGYDVVTRDFIEGTLRAGDLFVAVGAHWGLFTLQAATHPAGDICVVAFEPDPWNATVLFKNVFSNERFDRVRVVCAACGDAAGLGPLVSNGSMAHSLEGGSLTETAVRLPPKWVAIVALDRALASRVRVARLCFACSTCSEAAASAACWVQKIQSRSTWIWTTRETCSRPVQRLGQAFSPARLAGPMGIEDAPMVASAR